MKKILSLIIVLVLTVSLCGCSSTDSKRFKEEYESRNGEKTSSGKEYRNITIDNNNPFKYITLEDLNKKIENKENLIVYFGAWWCPWCRSVLPTAISEAKNNNIKTIYYINVRDSLSEEDDIRDIYSINDNKEIYLSHKGTEAYHKFLSLADNVLKTYSNHGVEYSEVKRVGAPNFIMFKEGVATKLITGISEKETDSYMELTDEINEDMKNIFNDFYREFS